MDRAPGFSVRLKLTLSYAGFLMLAGALLLSAVWVFLLRYIPDRLIIDPTRTDTHGVFPVRSNLLRAFAPAAAVVLASMLVIGLLGGWLLAGRMLAPPCSHHRCHAHGRDRLALPSNPAAGPPR